MARKPVGNLAYSAQCRHRTTHATIYGVRRFRTTASATQFWYATGRDTTVKLTK